MSKPWEIRFIYCDLHSYLQLLQEEVSRQQIIINQTSQALSLIACNESLRNTMEEIEAEKMMVISSKCLLFSSQSYFVYLPVSSLSFFLHLFFICACLKVKNNCEVHKERVTCPFVNELFRCI